MKQGILQFVIVRPACAMAAIVLEACSLYDDSSFALNNGFVYLTTIVNISMTVRSAQHPSSPVHWPQPRDDPLSLPSQVSLYCLVLFYMAAEMRLDPFRPLPKFLCIKAVLFFSFWCVLPHAWGKDASPSPVVTASLHTHSPQAILRAGRARLVRRRARPAHCGGRLGARGHAAGALPLARSARMCTCV